MAVFAFNEVCNLPFFVARFRTFSFSRLVMMCRFWKKGLQWKCIFIVPFDLHITLIWLFQGSKPKARSTQAKFLKQQHAIMLHATCCTRLVTLY